MADYTRPLPEHMVAIKHIQPMDIDGFIILLEKFIFSAALRNHSNIPLGRQAWYQGVEFLLGALKQVPPEAG